MRDSVILELRELFSPQNNTAVVPPFEFNYIESAATGSIMFYGNPSIGNMLTIGLNNITFGTDVAIGATQQITLANLVAYINAHSSTLLVVATTNSIPNKIALVAVTTGVAGNSITLATTSTVLKVSAPTLTQGGLFDFDNSEIFISDAIPQNYQDWPCLIVDTASASETRYLGPEDAFELKNSSNVVTTSEIFSSLVVNVNIKLYVIDDTLARDKILDLIYNNISEIRTVLAQNGIEMIDRSMPTETRTFQDQRQYITNSFILRVYCEWSDNQEITNITSIGISVPVQTALAPIINSPLSASYSHGVQFVVDSVVDGTHLNVESATGMANGNTIVQGTHSTTIINIIDNNHLEVGDTTGWVIGMATDASVNLPFSYQITALNNPTLPYGWVAVPPPASPVLPPGLSLDSSNGLISGIPSVNGTYYITLSASNATGTGTGSLTLTVS